MVYKKKKGLKYNIDFRGNTQSSIEADGWTFTGRGSASWTIGSSGLSIVSTYQVFVNRTVDLSNAKTISMTGTGYLANKSSIWDGGLSLFICQETGDFFDDTKRVASYANRNVGTSAINRGYRLVLNNSDQTTGTALSAGEYTWTLDVNLDTGEVSGTCNTLSLSGTLTSTYLGYIKTSQRIGVVADSSQHIIHTLNVEIN